MKDIIKMVVNHPIASILVIGSTCNGISNIISAAKGTGVKPMIDITTTSVPENTEK